MFRVKASDIHFESSSSMRYGAWGGSELIPLDARLVAATHRDVNELLAEGILCQDLYYRLSVVRLRLPPRRERSDDIPAPVDHFLQLACTRHGREPKRDQRVGHRDPSEIRPAASP
jgi:DNA-binding NtrC family response regulator